MADRLFSYSQPFGSANQNGVTHTAKAATCEMPIWFQPKDEILKELRQLPTESTDDFKFARLAERFGHPLVVWNGHPFIGRKWDRVRGGHAEMLRKLRQQ